MSSNVIVGILDRYAEKVAAVAVIQAQIDKLAGDLLTQRIRLETEADELAAQAKDKAKFIPGSLAHTLVGKFFQLVFNSPKPKLDEHKVFSLVLRYNALLQDVRQLPGDAALDLGNKYNLVIDPDAELKSEPDPYWSLKKVGKGK